VRWNKGERFADPHRHEGLPRSMARAMLREPMKQPRLQISTVSCSCNVWRSPDHLYPMTSPVWSRSL
jgi:hypothetical protein